MLVSGVIACKCARHDIYRPGAVVDLKKGERCVCSHSALMRRPDAHFSFVYTDFALHQGLEGYEDYEHIVLSYDISCQYCKKLAQRFRQHFPRLEKTIKRIRCFVPKLHGHGHSEDCRYRYSLDFAPNVGRTHGERIEGGWAEGNLAGPSTREMNPGHRHETLSAYYNESNYQQSYRMGMYL